MLLQINTIQSNRICCVCVCTQYLYPPVMETQHLFMKNLHFLASSYRNKIIYSHKQLILFLEHEKVKTHDCNAFIYWSFAFWKYQLPPVRALYSIAAEGSISHGIPNLWVFCHCSVQNNHMHNSALRGAELTHAAFLSPLIVFIWNWGNKKAQWTCLSLEFPQQVCGWREVKP